MNEASLGTWALGILGMVVVAFITAFLTSRTTKAQFEAQLMPLEDRWDKHQTQIAGQLGARIDRAERDRSDSEAQMKETFTKLNHMITDHTAKLVTQETVLQTIEGNIKEMKHLLQQAAEQKVLDLEETIKVLQAEVRKGFNRRRD